MPGGPATLRTQCLRCRRPASECVCAHIRQVPSTTRVVFLQHPREARMPVSTCRLAHLSLPNSELHVGLRLEGSARLEAIARRLGTMVLFPGDEATDVRDLAVPPATLLVVDGTWINARKLVERSPLLRALPRVGFVPDRPSTYRIRREPAPHCLSTIEAVAHVLDAIEATPGRFAPILGSFDYLIERQLTWIHDPTVDRRPRHAPRPSPADRLRALGPRLVLVHAEAISVTDDPADGQRLDWIAVRPATGERFRVHVHLPEPISPHRSRTGAPPLLPPLDPSAAADAWVHFAGPDGVVGTWGPHAARLLQAAGLPSGEPLDLKRLVSNVLHGPMGGLEALAERLGVRLPDRQGRAPRVLLALESVVAALGEGTLTGGRAAPANYQAQSR